MKQTRPHIFGLTFRELNRLIAFSVLASVVAVSMGREKDPWVYAGVAFFFFVSGQMCLMAPRCLVLPELIAWVACLQWLVVPWLSYLAEPSHPVYKMSVPAGQYFAYSVPAVFALWTGLHLPIRLLAQPASRKTAPPKDVSARERRLMDALIVFGCVVMAVSRRLPQEFSFFYFVFAQLRFVGAFALMFAKAPGWPVRMGAVCLSLFIDGSVGGGVYGLVLWGGYLAIGLAYFGRWRWKLAAALVLVLLAAACLGDWRAKAQEEHSSSLGDELAVVDQGWITARVMTTVPRLEPYAHGKSVLNALVSPLMPSFVLKEGLRTRSKEFFRRYADLELAPNSRAEIGIAGELYANFGRWGGALAALVYGVTVGLIFSFFARAAKTEMLWWAWAPFVLLSSVQAEWDLVNIVSNLLKSSMVMFVLFDAVPALKRRYVTKPSVRPVAGRGATSPW